MLLVMVCYHVVRAFEPEKWLCYEAGEFGICWKYKHTLLLKMPVLYKMVNAVTKKL